jgi:hypothetical protein
MTVPPAADAFSAHPAEFTAQRRRLMPGFDAFGGAVVDVLGAPADGPLDAIDRVSEGSRVAVMAGFKDDEA